MPGVDLTELVYTRGFRLVWSIPYVLNLKVEDGFMGDSKKQGDPRSDQIEHEDEIARSDEDTRNPGDEVDPLDELDDLLYFKDDSADLHDSSSMSQEPDSSEIPDPRESNQAAFTPRRPADTNEAIDDDSSVREDSAVQDSSSPSNHSIPLQESNDNSQEGDLFDLLGEDSEVSSTDETILENSGSDDAVRAPLNVQDKLGSADDWVVSGSSDSDRLNESVESEIESGPESGIDKGAKNQSDAEQVLESVSEQEFELESELDSEVELESGSDANLDDELDADPDSDFESVPSDRSGYSVESELNESDEFGSEADLEFVMDGGEPMNSIDPKGNPTHTQTADNRSIDDSADQNIPGDLDNTELSFEHSSETGVGQSEIDAEAETRSAVKSILSDAGQGIAQDLLHGSEENSVPAKVEKQSTRNETGKNSQSKLGLNFQNGVRETLDIDREEDAEMKWFTIGIPIVLVVAVTVMGGYIFSLQSQIDELHLLLPLDQENVFGSDTSASVDLANDAIIENINARIDNLADTLELIATANQREDKNPANESLPRSDSGSSGTDNGRTANRVAAVLAGEAEIRELNSRLDGLSKSFETITGTINKQGSQITELNLLANSKAPAPKGIKEVNQPPLPVAKNKIPDGSGAVVMKSAKPIEKPSAKPYEIPQKKSPAPTKVLVKKGAWSVNLMSLKDQAIATKQLESFRKRGVSAEINRKHISGKTWYRVQVSGFKTKQLAKKYAASVKKKLGLSGTWVTR